MKILVGLLLTLFLMSCSKNSDIDIELASKVEKESLDLLTRHEYESFNVDLDGSAAINGLNPEKVYITESGIYIVLKASMAQENGIFIPRASFEVDTSTGQDPSYDHLSGKVYRYNIKG